MTDTDTEIVEEYPHDCRIVREKRESEDLFHYEGPLGPVKAFENPDKARLYADVQTVVGGFREDKTGERGVPPAVARAREDILMAYLVSNPTMGVEWVARFYDTDQTVVRDYVRRVREQATQRRDEDTDEKYTVEPPTDHEQLIEEVEDLVEEGDEDTDGRRYYCVSCGWTGVVGDEIPAVPSDCPDCGEPAPKRVSSEQRGER